MALVKYESQSKDLSEVLVKVKQDLLKLREKIEVRILPRSIDVRGRP